MARTNSSFATYDLHVDCLESKVSALAPNDLRLFQRLECLVWRAAIFCFLLLGFQTTAPAFDDLTEADMKLIRAVEAQRIATINKVIGSVIAIYDDDRQGGGSGVIIDPSGIALTNHHVIMGAGIEGWGGLADGKMYKWKLIGTDPGGDVSIIQMEGRDDFPFTPLGDSDDVRVGDWALAMGNPFILTEDQSPTVTLGIVSGVKRYQHGAGLNQLVYGNCIQVDSSINPGNSGGPLFSLKGEVIGINGRGSFKARGRVNVGLGYAISSNQIKNFIPELLATKLVEHATLDASFSDREGKVVCSTINLDSPIAKAGLKLGDELLEFEGTKILNANQFTNLICTLPEDWPTQLKIRSKEDDKVSTVWVRAFGLPYRRPKVPKKQPQGKKTPDQEKQLKRQRQMVELLAADPGTMRFKNINRKYAGHILKNWKSNDGLTEKLSETGVAVVTDRFERKGEDVGTQTLWLASDGRFKVEFTLADETAVYMYNGKNFYRVVDESAEELSLVEAKVSLPCVQAVGMMAAMQEKPFSAFGEYLLDGADKAINQNAYRMKYQDEDDDPFYVWLRMYGDDGEMSSRLLKASANIDADDKGGVTFDDWKKVGPAKLPLRREFVTGLAEKQIVVIKNKKAEWLDDFESSLFDVPGIEFAEVETEAATDSDRLAKEKDEESLERPADGDAGRENGQTSQTEETTESETTNTADGKAGKGK